MKHFIKLVIKRNEQDLVALFMFFIALLGLNIITEHLKASGVNWYWIMTYNFIFLIILRVVEIILSYLFSNWNQKVHFGFYVLAAIMAALLNTFIF